MHTYKDLEYIFLETLVNLNAFDKCDFDSLSDNYKDKTVAITFTYVPTNDDIAILTSYNEMLKKYNELKEALLAKRVDSELVTVAPSVTCLNVQIKLSNLTR